MRGRRPLARRRAWLLQALALLLAAPRSQLRSAPLISGSPAEQVARQRALVEAIYRRQRERADQALAQLTTRDFASDIALRDAEGRPQSFLWDYYRPDYNCPLRERVGDNGRVGDGGKWVCGVDTLLQKHGCVVYSFGSDGDTAFERALLATTPCAVHVFDPTLSLGKLEAVRSVPGLQYHRYGLGGFNGYLDGGPGVAIGIGRPTFPVKTLGTVMKELGHKWVDVLKIDVEGSEWPALEQMLAAHQPLPFTQLQVELHHWERDAFQPRRKLKVLNRLVSKGRMRCFSVEPNYWSDAQSFLEMSFLQVDKQGEIVVGP